MVAECRAAWSELKEQAFVHRQGQATPVVNGMRDWQRTRGDADPTSAFGDLSMSAASKIATPGGRTFGRIRYRPLPGIRVMIPPHRRRGHEIALPDREVP